MTPEKLLAKSARPGKTPLSLEKHLRDTEQAASLVFRLDQRWGQNWCRFFRVHDEDRERFLLNLRVAAILHDLGKANRSFLDAVTSKGFTRQVLRHEHLSALFLHLPALRGWLAECADLDLEVITAAVLSHHLKASEDGDWRWCQSQGASSVALFLQHPEVHNTLRKLAEITGLSGIPELPANPWGNAAPWNEAYADGRATASHFRRTVARNPRRRSLLLAVKAGLVVSDSVASGLVREEINILDWIQDVAHREPLTAEMLREHVIEPRIQKLSRKGPFQWHRFQELAAQQDSRALLLAACGTGKSMAAWRWAETQLRKHSLGKVLFLYPTRGTATEGFRDYVGWAPEDDAALLHGSSRYELEAMQHNPEEPLTQKGVRGPTEGEQRLYSLAFWPRRYFSATVDQFLGFLENSYGSLCLLPVLADSAVIIDEVHSFDRKMFDGLIAFLQAFDVPVLCMTATLAPGRREELIKAGLRVFPSEQDREQLQDLAAKEQHPRYELRTVDGSHTAFHIATQAFREGKRVLWVVNRVARCQELARLLAAELGKSPHCYHSRFRLRDRQAVHQKTIQAFQQREQAAIAVTTQVCEMSLDLDADVLISELAPPSSLVQRFGRANRHLARGDDFRAQLVVYQPDSHRPYEKSDLLAAEKFLAGLGQVVSQHQLALALEKHAAEERIADGSTAFLRGDYFAVAGEFRDSDDISERCVLDSDLRDVQDCLRAHQPYDGFLVSIPRKEPTTDPPATLPRFLRVAQKARYDDLLGYVAGEG